MKLKKNYTTSKQEWNQVSIWRASVLLRVMKWKISGKAMTTGRATWTGGLEKGWCMVTPWRAPSSMEEVSTQHRVDRVSAGIELLIYGEWGRPWESEEISGATSCIRILKFVYPTLLDVEYLIYAASKKQTKGFSSSFQPIFIEGQGGKVF